MAIEDRLRLLLLAPTGFFADYGCHVRIRGQAESLQARGHKVLLCTYPGGRDVPGVLSVRPPLWPRKQEMPVGSSWLKLALDLALAPTALAAALRFRPHVIHAYLHEGALIGSVLAQLLGCPLVFDYQGSLVEEMLDHSFISSSSRVLPLLRRLERGINSRPAVLLASSKHAARLVTQAQDLSAVTVGTLPDSVDPDRFHPPLDSEQATLAEVRQGLSIAPTNQLVVYLGLLAEYQGIDLLLQAARIVVKAAPHLRPHFLVMGFPFVEHYRRMAIDMGLSGQVTFTGKVRYEDAPRYLALGQVAVAPKLSATEGSGKLLNYMAMALPVAAFDTAVHREYLGEMGVYAPAGDAGALATAVISLLRQPADAARRGRALRQSAIERYSWSHAAAEIESVYRQVMSASQSAS